MSELWAKMTATVVDGNRALRDANDFEAMLIRARCDEKIARLARNWRFARERTQR